MSDKGEIKILNSFLFLWVWVAVYLLLCRSTTEKWSNKERMLLINAKNIICFFKFAISAYFNFKRCVLGSEQKLLFSVVAFDTTKFEGEYQENNFSILMELAKDYKRKKNTERWRSHTHMQTLIGFSKTNSISIKQKG